MPMTLDGTAGMTVPQGAVYNGLATAAAQASTSGTSIDFTGIPVWVKRITVMFSGISTSGSSNLLVQIGSGSVTTSGYSSGVGNAGGTASVNSTAGFILTADNAAANSSSGIVTITNLTGNTWASAHSLGRVSGSATACSGGGAVSLSGTLDRVRITTVGGTDTFDAGTINVMYE